VETLSRVHEAISGGATVLGYCYWTLNYDYEWNDGWTQDMGLFGIAGFDGHAGKPLPDGGVWAPGPGTDFTREPLRPMTDVYTQIATDNGLRKALVDRYAP
jgi:beta-glucosidase/6-phospho-beta-glucosidase/beta-galactosidase